MDLDRINVKTATWFTQHWDEGHEMVFAIDAEYGKGLSIDVGVPQSTRFDDGPDVVALWIPKRECDPRVIQKLETTISQGTFKEES